MIKARLPNFVLSSAIILAVCAFISGCTAKKVANEPAITAEELRAWCPSITMDSDKAFYNIYARGADANPDKVVYQATLTNVTRNCQYPDNKISMVAAAAGRIIPGPQFSGTSVKIPIWVKVVEADKVIYSKKHSYLVPIANRSEAAQFIFKDEQVSFPKPQGQNVKVFIGFDVKTPTKKSNDTSENALEN